MSRELSSLSGPSLPGEVSAALRRGDRVAAQRLLVETAGASESMLTAADMAMNERRWGDGAWLLDQVSHAPDGVSIKRNLCRNLSALQSHRPELYNQFITLPRNDTVGVGVSASGHATIVCKTASGQNMALSPGNMPLTGVAAALHHLRSLIEAGACFALAGLGDGYLLHHLARHPPRLYMDTQLSVFVLERNAHVALTALMIHDYSGPDGPIEQQRFHWFIGDGWDARLRQTVLGDLLLPCPHVSIALGLEADGVQKTLNTVIAELVAMDERHRETIDVHYASRTSEQIAAPFGPNPSQRPRVLLLTTRFSTVLQYATADAERAFVDAGWETRTLIEPTPWHRIMTIGTRQLLAGFKPDVVLQIDHQRSEHPGMFPQGLPFVCWIQDHMDQLMSRQAGAGVGPYDFVLTDAGPTYVHSYGYPSNQIIAAAKLTAPPSLLPRPRKVLHDLAYVSNASATPQSLRDRLVEKLGMDGNTRRAIVACIDRIVALHDVGEALSTYPDVCGFVRAAMAEARVTLTDEQLRTLCREINHPLCDSLYRQQALRWIASAAGEMGLNLGLYGNGWEQHPEFAAFARGRVAAGRPHHELARGAAISFQIAPYLCLHQRLLDGVCSGGFFLVRRHVSDTAPQALLDLLEANCPSGVDRLARARAVVPPPVRDRFEHLSKDCQRALCSTGTEDAIEMVRAWQEAQLLVPGAGVLPHLDSVSFEDAAELKQRLTRFVRDPDLRESISAEQRESINARLTYAMTMRRAVARIGRLLPRQTAKPLVAIPISLEIGRAA